jgi:3-deoxy-D-arabino-heptulosonate 7-phosphate (DAHP) synthase class II
MTPAERYIILNAAWRVLDEMAVELQTRGSDPSLAHGRGVAMHASRAAAQAVFGALNHLSVYGGDAAAKEAIDAHNERRDLDPEVLIAALRLSERERHPAQVCSDGEHEADIEAGDMLGRRP